jgi:hypothetical protein
MDRTTAILERSAEAGLETGELAHTSGLDLNPRASRGSGRTTIDLLLVYSPTARPLASRNGVRRWEYRGRIYREIPLEALYAWDDEDQSTREFCRMDSLMRAKPHRRRAA